MIHKIILVAFLIWSFPLGVFRSKFRKMVYQTQSWFINIKPVFVKEIKVLFGSIKLSNTTDIKLKNSYAFYLSVYVTLLALLYLIK